MMPKVMTTLMHRLLLAVLLLLPLAAQADRNMAARYVTNTEGDITLIGNAALTCSTSATGCSAALAGGNDRNDNYNMVYIDIDSDSTTFMSSSANLNMPSGSTVLFAGLYWSGLSADAARSQVLMKTPTSFGYSNVNASVIDTTSFRTTSYQGFADVTTQVRAAGNGTYTVANVQSTTGTGNYGAWGLIVVYKNSGLSLRNLAVYDGFTQLAGTSATIPVSGFLTPLSGPVNTRLGVLSYEGDLPATGDTFSLNGTQLTDANNPVNNFYNATISDLGVHNTARNPASINNLVFDIDRINIPSGVVGNGATSATINVSSPDTSETFLLGVVTFATDLYVPIITPNIVKTATDVNGGQLVAGDVLRWTVTMSNTGLDTATNLTVTDPLPAQVTYSPGTLKIATGANTGNKTDASGDDVAEYVSGSNQVVFRLGTGATASAGGNLPYGASTSFTFDTIVNSGLPAGTGITNTVNVSYRGQTIGDTYAGAGAAASAVIMGPPAIAKSFAPTSIDVGSVSVLSIVVSNPAANPATLTGVAFTDTYPSGLVNAASPNASVNCTSGSSGGTLSGGGAGLGTIGLSGASIVAGGSCTVTVNVTSATAGSYSNTTSTVSSSNGGTGPAATAAVLAVGKPSITKAFSPTTIVAGSTSVITFTLSNPTAATRTGVSFSDTLTNMVVAGTPAVSNGCGGTVTATAGASSIALSGGTLNASASCSINVTVTSSTGGLLPNTTTGVTTTQTAVGNPSNTAVLTVIAPPVVTKSFSPATVRVGVLSQMTLTVSNPNTTTTLTGVAFTDGVSPAYPAGMANGTSPNVTLNCSSGSTATLSGGAASGTNVGLTGGTLAPGGSCTIVINVVASTSGSKVNTTNAPTSTNGGTGTAASATLTVSTFAAPTVTKAFGASSILQSGTTTLTITLTNTNTTAITGVAFTDSFPLGMVVATTPSLTNTCTGTVTGASSGSTALSLSGGTIPASGSCLVRVTISGQAGDYYNSTGSISASNAGGDFGPAFASLTIVAPPVVSKSFSPAAVAVGNGSDGNYSTLTITLTNPNSTFDLSGLYVEDFFPANLVTYGTTKVNNCSTTNSTFQARNGTNWTSTFAAGYTGVRVQNISLDAGATCTLSLRVRSGTAGVYTNTTAAITSTDGGTGNTATAVLTVGRPSLSKAFAPTAIGGGGTSVLTLTLQNPTATAMTAAAVTDTYPTGMTNTASPSGATTCGGTVTAAANGGSVALSGGTIPANGSCTVTVNVTTTQTVTNTVAAGGLTVNGGGSNGNDATATLTLYDAPQMSKSFSPTQIVLNGSSQLTITLVNPNPTAVNAAGVAVADVFPTGMVVAATPSASTTCGGTLQGRTGSGSYGTIAAGNTEVRITGGSITGNSSCSIVVNVTSSTAAAYTNTTGALTTTNIGGASAASAVLTVLGPPVLAKSFSPTSVLVNDVSVLTLTLTNNNTAAVTGAAVTDTYPTNLVNDSSPNATTSCTGATLTATAGGGSVAIADASIPANSSCTVTIRVKSATAGSYVNTTGTVSTTNAGTGAAASATLTVTLPQPSLTLTKLVSVLSDPVNGGTFPKSIPGAISTYTIRLTNGGPGTVDNNTVVVSDPLPTQVDLYVGDIGTAGSGPFVYTNGSPTSGLTCTYVSLASTTDCVDFSTNGTNWTPTITPDGAGFAPAIRYIRFKPTGTMNGASGGNPYAEFQFRVRVK